MLDGQLADLYFFSELQNTLGALQYLRVQFARATYMFVGEYARYIAVRASIGCRCDVHVCWGRYMAITDARVFVQERTKPLRG